MYRRIYTTLLLIIVMVMAAVPSMALRRHSVDHPFFNRTAVSGYFGSGIPVGEFSSEKIGDGNHESGAFDWSAEIEHFVGPGLSLGLNISHTSYDDKEFGEDLKTNISIFGGFLRYVVDTSGPVYPFLRFGFGSMELEFEDPEFRVESEHSGSLHIGGGGLFMVGEHISFNASALYTFGFTDEAQVGDTFEEDGVLVVEVVGFDVEYWTFAAGISVYFP